MYELEVADFDPIFDALIRKVYKIADEGMKREYAKERIAQVLAESPVKYPVACPNCGRDFCWECEDNT